MLKKLTCPKCREPIKVELQPGVNQVECPICFSDFKVKLRQDASEKSKSDAPAKGERKSKREKVERDDDAFHLAAGPSGKDDFDLDDDWDDDFANGLEEDQQEFSESDGWDDEDEYEPRLPKKRPSKKRSPKKKKSRPQESRRPTPQKTGLMDKLSQMPPELKNRLALIGGGVVTLGIMLVLAIKIFTGGSAEEGGGGDDINGVPAEVGLDDGSFVLVSALPPGVEVSKPNDRIDQSQSNLGLQPIDSAVAIAPGGTLEAPGEWKPLPVLEPSPEIERRPLSNVPSAFNNGEYVLVYSTKSASGPRQEAFARGKINALISEDVYWRKFSWKTGEPVSSLRWLGSKGVPARQQEPSQPPPSQIVAGLSSDGSRFAAEDIGEPGNVRVWIGDGEPFEFAVGADDNRIRWIDWNEAGQLLTLSGPGELAAWSVKDDSIESEPLWRVQGDEASFVSYAPGRDWLALGAQSTIHLIDPETGETRGQLHAESETTRRDIAISTDGQKLASIAIPEIGPNNRGNRDEPHGELFVWDLQTGNARKAALEMELLNPFDLKKQPSQFRCLRWLAPDRLMIDGVIVSSRYLFGGSARMVPEPKGCVYDVNTLQLAGAVHLNEKASEKYARFYFDASGQAWSLSWQGQTPTYYPVSYLDAKLENHQVLLGKSAEPRPEDQPKVQIAVDAGSEADSRKRAEAVAIYLAEQGVEIGASDFTLRAKFFVIEGDERPEELREHFVIREAAGGSSIGELQMGARKVMVPTVMGSWKLFDADGKECWKTASQELWQVSSSKFKTSSKLERWSGHMQEYSVQFDFGNQNVQKAIAEEILQKDIKPEKVIYELASLIKGGANFRVPEPILSALDQLEASEESSDDWNEAMAVVAENVNHPEISNRQRDLLKDVAEHKGDKRSMESKLLKLKLTDHNVDTRPPIVRFARFEASDFPGMLPGEAEREAVDPWQKSVAAVWNISPDPGRKAIVRFLKPPGLYFTPEADTVRVSSDAALFSVNRKTGELADTISLDSAPLRDPIIAVCPTFKNVACLSEKALTIVDAKDHRRQTVVSTLDRRGAQNVSAAFSPDGRYLLFWSNQTLALWDIRKKQIAQQTPAEAPQFQMVFSPDSKLYCVMEKTGLRFLKIPSFEPAGELTLWETLFRQNFAVSHDFSQLAWFLGGDETGVCAQSIERASDANVTAKGEVKSFYFLGKPLAVAVNSDGSKLATITSSYRVHNIRLPGTFRAYIWETGTGKLIRKAKLSEDDVMGGKPPSRDIPPIQLSFATGDAELVVSTGIGNAIFVDLASPGDELLASAAEPARLNLLEKIAGKTGPAAKTGSGEYSQSPAFLGEIPITEPIDEISSRFSRDVSFGSKGELLRVYNGEKFLIYNAETRELVDKLEFIKPDHGKDFMGRRQHPARISDDSDTAVFQDWERNLVLVKKGAAKSKLLRLEGPKDRTYIQHPIVFSSDGVRFFAESGEPDKNIVIWSVSRGRVIKDDKIDHFSREAQLVRGDTLFGITNFDMVYVFDARALKPVAEIKVEPGSNNRRVRFSHFHFAEDGKAFAATNGRECFVWRNSRGIDKLKADAEPQRIVETGEVAHLKLDSKGRWLLTGVEAAVGRSTADEAMLRIHDLDQGFVVAELGNLAEGERFDIKLIRFCVSPDDKRLAVYFNDKVLLFDMTRLIPE